MVNHSDNDNSTLARGQRILDEIRRKVSGSPQGFWDCDSDLVALARSGYFEAALSERLERLLSIAGTNQTLFDVAAGYFVPHSEPDYVVELVLFRRPPKYIYRHPAHALYCPIRGGLLQANRYRMSAISPDHDVPPADAVISQSSVQTVARFETVKRNGLLDVLDMFPVDAPVLVARIVTTPLASTEWSFHRETGKLWNVSAMDGRSSHLMSMTRLAGILGDKSSIEPLRHVSEEHGDHFVRWAAVQNLARIDGAAGLAAVQRRLLVDTHPHVKSAAEATLRALETRRQQASNAASSN